MHTSTLHHLFIFSLFLVGSHTAPNRPDRPPPTRLMARDPRGNNGGNTWGGGGGVGDFAMIQSACAGVSGPATTGTIFSLKANLPPGGGTGTGGGAGAGAGVSSVASAPPSQSSLTGSKMVRRELGDVVPNKRAPEPQQSQVSTKTGGGPPGQIPQAVLLKICPHIMAFTANGPPLANAAGHGPPVQAGQSSAVQSVPIAQSTSG